MIDMTELHKEQKVDEVKVPSGRVSSHQTEQLTFKIQAHLSRPTSPSPRARQWFDLEETSTGKLHLKLEWLSLLSTAEKLEQVQRRLSDASCRSRRPCQVHPAASPRLPLRCCAACGRTEAWPTTACPRRCWWSTWTQRTTCL